MRVYVTQPAPKIFRQMSIDDLLFNDNPKPSVINENRTNTRTDAYAFLPPRLRQTAKVPAMAHMLANFNAKYADLYEQRRETLYETFYRAKKDKGMKKFFKDMFASQPRYVKCDSGKVCGDVAGHIHRLCAQHATPEDDGLRADVFGKISEVLTSAGFDASLFDAPAAFKTAFRRIDAPVSSLQRALDELKDLFEEPEFNALYHTSAFAYVRGRSVIDAVKRHQTNDSHWFAKLDFSDFFGSTTPEFVTKMLQMVYPFSELIANDSGRELLEKALDLAFLGGHLPQGTPISPLITNLMMIPIDHTLSNDFRDFNGQKYIYTRYADDILVSSRYGFDVKKIENAIKITLDLFGAPFSINESKTRYGSRAGSNWNLGVMLNKDNEITVGWRKKREFQSMLHSYVLDKRNGKQWDIGRVYALEGLRSYYKMVEGDTIDRIVAHVGGKLGADIPAMIKDDIRNLI